MPEPSPSAPSNRLAGETSPYLLQHAHNPVDWYRWGEEALARARQLDRPIFLSIGYAACHWCHVMERESFEDAATAEQLNAGFVAIKVDREERPDLDAIYMAAVQAMTGQGGWPMSVFLTPDGRPFHGGTYFPAEPRFGLPSFRQVLAGVARAWQLERPNLEAAAERAAQAIAARNAAPVVAAAAAPRGLVGLDGQPLAALRPARPALDELPLRQAREALEAAFDEANGGWGGAPKFPPPMTIEFLLRHHVATGAGQPLAMARRTLDAMAAGGIYDQLGGGFARYATDAAWLVPHFEKMLSDNAQLARVYLHAWQLTGEPRYREVAEATLDFLVRDMTAANGAFAASLDADTRGEEGGAYVWTAAEVRATLGDAADLFAAAYDVTAEGNWEGRTILHRARSDADLARELGLPVSQVTARLAASRERLHEHRRARPQPARDDKVLAAWNGLALAAIAEAARGLGRGDYREAAERAAEALLRDLRTPDGRLLRSWRDGRAQHAGVLEDHANLAEGLLTLYETTFDERWFGAARDLLEIVLRRFADPAGGFFDTADDGERLIARPKGLEDNAVPSGNAMAAAVLLRFAALTGEGRYRDAAETALGTVIGLLGRYPTAFAQWLTALELAVRPLDEVAIVGEPDAPATGWLLTALRDQYRPSVVVASASTAAAAASAVPLLRGRGQVEGKPTAYVCRGLSCRQPVTDPAALLAQLGSGGGSR